jgi:hypothetical protein
MATDTMNITAQRIFDVYTGNYYGVAKFDFPNINLLDSSHHGKCDGGVIYTIKTRPGLLRGSHVDNRAGIYFDINPVVMTNTADNMIGCPSLEVITPANKTDLYPNPTNKDLTITSGDAITTIAISNLLGQEVYSHQYNAPQVQVDVSAFPAGVYLIKINGTEVRKFVKQ